MCAIVTDAKNRRLRDVLRCLFLGGTTTFHQRVAIAAAVS
jgi:hypothetical protein